jgi:hypothetical protein
MAAQAAHRRDEMLCRIQAGCFMVSDFEFDWVGRTRLANPRLTRTGTLDRNVCG